MDVEIIEEASNRVIYSPSKGYIWFDYQAKCTFSNSHNCYVIFTVPLPDIVRTLMRRTYTGGTNQWFRLASVVSGYADIETGTTEEHFLKRQLLKENSNGLIVETYSFPDGTYNIFISGFLPLKV